jgi:hypothetical protein
MIGRVSDGRWPGLAEGNARLRQATPLAHQSIATWWPGGVLVVVTGAGDVDLRFLDA